MTARVFQIRTYADARAWLTEDQLDVWRYWLAQVYGHQMPHYPGVRAAVKSNRDVWSAIDGALKDKAAFISLDAVFATLADALAAGFHRAAAVGDKLLKRRTLQEANHQLAAAMAAKAPLEAVRELAAGLGVKTDLGEQDMRAAVALQAALQATALGKTLPELEREFNAYGDVVPWGQKRADADAGKLLDDLQPVARLRTERTGPQGAGSVLSEFFADVGDWFNDAVIKHLGRVLVSIGESILALRDSVPFLGTFFLDPLGFTAQAVFLEELGKAAIDGSISTFNEARFGMAIGNTFVAAGQMLAIAAPLLPPPFNLLAGVLAAASIAVGNIIVLGIQQERASRLREEQVKQLEDAARQEEQRAREEQEQAQQELAQAEQELAELHERADKTAHQRPQAKGRIVALVAGAGAAIAAGVAVVVGVMFTGR